MENDIKKLFQLTEYENQPYMQYIKSATMTNEERGIENEQAIQ